MIAKVVGWLTKTTLPLGYGLPRDQLWSFTVTLVPRRVRQSICDQIEHFIAIKPQGLLGFKNELVTFSGRDYRMDGLNKGQQGHGVAVTITFCCGPFDQVIV